MNATKQEPRLKSFLRYFSDSNRNRPTRIGFFETISVVTNDYWIEDGLPLRGIDIEMKNGTAVIEIMLEGYTHVVPGVRAIRPIYTIDGAEDGIDLIGRGETTTILRFEN